MLASCAGCYQRGPLRDEPNAAVHREIYAFDGAYVTTSVLAKAWP